MEDKNNKKSIDININLNQDKREATTGNSKTEETPEPTTQDSLANNKTEKGNLASDLTESSSVDTNIDNKDNTHQEDGIMSDKKETTVSTNNKPDIMGQQLTKLTQRLDNLELENQTLKDQVAVKESQLKELQLNSEKLKKEMTKSSYQIFKEKHLNEGNIVEEQLMKDDTEGVERLETLYLSLDEKQREYLDDFIKRSPLKTALSIAESRKTSNPEGNNPHEALPKSEWIDKRIDSKIAQLSAEMGKSPFDIKNDDDIYYRIQNEAYMEWRDNHSSSY